MVLMFEPMYRAIEAARAGLGGGSPRTVLLSPQGERLDQASVRRLAGCERLVLVCGRYEGVDERLVEATVDEEISLGDFVLSGGEPAALALIDAMVRLLPGALGHRDSAAEDSFADGLLDWPHYTRPERLGPEHGVRGVPPVLLGGNHGAVRRWREKQALGRTWLRRPDMLEEHELNAEKRTLLDEFKAEFRAAMRPASANTASTLS
jgi:tRNA (guanine37-N1)-methyltransferase